MPGLMSGDALKMRELLGLLQSTVDSRGSIPNHPSLPGGLARMIMSGAGGPQAAGLFQAATGRDVTSPGFQVPADYPGADAFGSPVAGSPEMAPEMAARIQALYEEIEAMRPQFGEMSDEEWAQFASEYVASQLGQ